LRYSSFYRNCSLLSDNFKKNYLKGCNDGF
jgi:hypothetical protein